jgi:hypothetical protein
VKVRPSLWKTFPRRLWSWRSTSPALFQASRHFVEKQVVEREPEAVLPARIDTWSLTSLQQRLVKTGGRLVTHARYYWLLLAESHLTRRLFGSMLRRIWALPVPTG